MPDGYLVRRPGRMAETAFSWTPTPKQMTRAAEILYAA